MWHKKHLIERQTLRLREDIQGRIFAPYSYVISYNIETTGLKTKTADEKTVSFYKRKVPPPLKIDGLDVVSGTPESISTATEQIQGPFRRFSLKL